MTKAQRLLKKYIKQSKKITCNNRGSHVDNSHTDVDAQPGHIDNGQ